MNLKTSTPVRATMVTMFAAGVLALIFDISLLSSLVSMGTLFSLGMVSLATIVRRYYMPGKGNSVMPVASRLGVLLFGAFFQGLAYSKEWHPATNGVFLGK